MTPSVLHRADTRGQAVHGWLDARHTFSFADYFDPLRMGFGALRVLNDDIIAPGQGFGTHPHDNMEIVTIPLDGALEHRDSMGHVSVIRKGEIQVMSAGTGIRHSEYNANSDKAAALLQIWVRPKERSVVPRYEQLSYFPMAGNTLKQIVSPDSRDEGSWIHQDAWFHYGRLGSGVLRYVVRRPGNGVYVFVIEGSVKIDKTVLDRRDGAGFENAEALDFEAVKEAEFLVIEVPMGA